MDSITAWDYITYEFGIYLWMASSVYIYGWNNIYGCLKCNLPNISILLGVKIQILLSNMEEQEATNVNQTSNNSTTTSEILGMCYPYLN